LIHLVPLSTIPSAEVETLLDAAFGTDRQMRTAYRIRQGMTAIDGLSFAAMEVDRLVGTIQAWPVVITSAGETDPITLVGPVAVLPDAQQKGIGKALMTRLLEAADAGESDAMVMIGDPEYYGRFFGFTANATAGWDVPGPVERHRLLARIRRPGEIAPVGMLGPDTGFARRADAA
jgi:predicted N-acetyltransferase YhbS